MKILTAHEARSMSRVINQEGSNIYTMIAYAASAGKYSYRVKGCLDCSVENELLNMGYDVVHLRNEINGRISYTEISWDEAEAKPVSITVDVREMKKQMKRLTKSFDKVFKIIDELKNVEIKVTATGKE
jgi:nucleoside-triphosphatase THEP1